MFRCPLSTETGGGVELTAGTPMACGAVAVPTGRTPDTTAGFLLPGNTARTHTPPNQRNAKTDAVSRTGSIRSQRQCSPLTLDPTSALAASMPIPAAVL